MNLIMLYSYTVILIFFLHLHFITEEQHAAQVWWKNYLHASTHPIPHLLIPSIYLSRCADSQPLPNNEINTFNWVQAQLMSHVPSWLKIPPTLGRVAWLRLVAGQDLVRSGCRPGHETLSRCRAPHQGSRVQHTTAAGRHAACRAELCIEIANTLNLFLWLWSEEVTVLSCDELSYPRLALISCLKVMSTRYWYITKWWQDHHQ